MRHCTDVDAYGNQREAIVSWASTLRFVTSARYRTKFWGVFYPSFSPRHQENSPQLKRRPSLTSPRYMRYGRFPKPSALLRTSSIFGKTITSPSNGFSPFNLVKSTHHSLNLSFKIRIWSKYFLGRSAGV